MTTAFRNWLSSASLFNTAPDDTSSEIVVQEPVDDAVDSGEDTAKEDDDRPPAFPAMNSAQRASSSPSAPPVVSIPAIVSVAPPAGSTDATLLIPPMPGRIGQRIPGVAPTNTKAKPSANTLMLPPSTTKPSTKAKKGEKVALAPGFGPLDWAALKTSGADLRGTGYPGLLRITAAELKQHRTRDDCWSAFNGKVYNITSYLPYHPGGEKELLRVAGRDGTNLFMSTHAWVNADYMLDACLIGVLVSDRS